MNKRNRKRKILWHRLALVACIPILVVCLFIWGLFSLFAGGSRPSPAPDKPVAQAAQNDPAKEPSDPSVTEAPESTQTEISASSQTDTSSPVIRQVSAPEDLQFLNQYSRAFLSGDTGSWYPGKTTRNLETGEVEYNWDRPADLLATLEEFDGIYRQNEDEKVCYLTFDCGFENGNTSIILDVLKEKNVPAAFFVTGDFIQSSPELLERMFAEGHIVGNHTVHHKNMVTIAPEEFVEEIMGNEALLKERFPQAPDMVYYRPPEGNISQQALALAKSMGLKTTMWSWTQYDYDPADQPDPVKALENAKTGLHNGCVYLLHAISSTNAQILPDLIDYIQQEGYEIRSLDA